LLVLALGFAAWHFRGQWLPWVESVLSKKEAGGPKGPPRAIPVSVAKVGERDLNLYINALGTVTAFNVVTVRSRVEGELIEVAFTEGQSVKAGDLLAQIDPRPFQMQRDQAQGQLDRDLATLKLGNATLGRQQRLLKSDATTQELVDQQVAIVEQAEAGVEVDRSLVRDAELQLDYCRITAPISGRVGLRLVDRGNIVRANDPNGLVVITQLEPISVVFTIPQDDIPRVQERMREAKSLPVDAYDREFQRKLSTGILAAIDNQVDSTTGTLKLKATFENADHTLFPNQFVNAKMLVDVIEKAVVTPAAAVQRGPNGTFVYIVKPDDTVDIQMVELGPSEAEDMSIVSGLSPGDLVVTDGVDKLLPGTKVAMPDREGKKGPPDKGAGKAAAGEKAAAT